MYRQIAIEVLLILALGAYGWTVHQVGIRDASIERVRANANLNLGLGQYTAVDLSGRLVSPSAVPDVTRVVTFLLRSQSLSEDLAVWQEVARRIPVPATRGIRLVGFCDALACAKAVKAYGEEMAFDLALFGEAVDLQAVLNADVSGQYLIQTDDGSAVAVVWRDVANAPDQIARRILE